MRAQTRDHAVDVTVEHACGVRDRLPKTQLDVLAREGGGRAAETCDPDLEADPGAVRRPLEQHGHVLALERPFRPAATLDVAGQVE